MTATNLLRGRDPDTPVALHPTPFGVGSETSIPHVSEPVLRPLQRAAHAALAVLWAFVCIRFWAWWLQPAHRGAPGLYWTATACLFYLSTILPTFYWFFVGRMRRPVHIPAPDGVRVALITPCVPSHESLDIIEAQLQALVAVDYPHDSWILDEGDDPDVRRLAERYGVRHFTRKGVAAYNVEFPPFQAKTKAGNVNAWLDAAGDDYEIFVQLDIDHLPEPEYLDRVLGYFQDPDVEWVQAPSVYRNLEHWTARGLAEQDVLLHGPLQMGFYGHSRTPFIIGSHTTYRTSAIRAIGGYQPTRAEDHLDTVVLAAHGGTGVYVPEILARGEGPEDFATYLGQQFAWAFSMIQILRDWTPRLVRRYSFRQAFQFLMAQSWYALWSLTLATMWFLPIVSLLSGRPIARVGLVEFLVYNLGVMVTATTLWWWGRDFFQPSGVRLSWRGIVLEIARWPIVLWALVNALLGVKRPYMITRKGGKMVALPSAGATYGSYIALALVGIGSMLAFALTIGHSATEGYVALVLYNTSMVLLPLGVVSTLEQRQLRVRLGGRLAAIRARAGVLATIFALLAGTVAAVLLAWPSLEVVA